MQRFVLLLILSLITVACQVSENVTPSLQSSGMSTPVSSPLQVKYPEEGWYKLNDLIELEMLHNDRIQVIGAPYLKAMIGVKLGIEYNCIPATDCPRSQSSGLSSIRFDPKNFFLSGGFTIILPGGSWLPIKFGAVANTIDTICSRCTGVEMAEDLANILESRLDESFEVKQNQNSVSVSAERRFYYATGNGTSKVIFSYRVSENDLDIDGIKFSETVEPANSLFVYNFTGKPSVAQYELDFTQKLLKLDGDVPRILSVTPPNAGFYDTGKSLNYRLIFSEEVIASTSETLGLSLTSTVPSAQYVSGSGSSSLFFTKKILAGDSNTVALTTSTQLPISTQIKDKAGNIVIRTLPLPLSSSNVIVNATSPTIQSISLVSAPGTYSSGGKVQFEVLFSESVNVATDTGLPALNLKLQTGIYEAKYKSGTGSNKLIFEYTVQTNHGSSGVEVISPLLLNGGKIKGVANNRDAVLIFSPQSSFDGITVDSLTGPYITSITPPAPGFYKENRELAFTFEYNSPVVISGAAPRIPILIGNETKYAVYSVAQSGNGKIVFTYTTTTLDEDVDGIFMSGPVENFSSIKDTNGKNSIPTFIPPFTREIRVDGSTPTIKSLTTPATGILLGGMNLDFIVEFSEDVTHTGTPTLPFKLSCAPACPNKIATFIEKLSGSKYLFRYKILNSDSSSGVTVLSPTETFSDQVGHNANLTLTGEQSNKSSVIIDAVVPEMTSITPPPNKTSYKVGDVLEFKIKWNNPVMINGIPKIQFKLRDTTDVVVEAIYIQDSNNPLSDESFFRYVVKTNDKASSGIKLVKLDLNGGSISDSSGNTATLPSLTNDFTGVKVDGVRPLVAEQTSPPDKLYKIGDTLFFSVTWNEPISVVGSPYILLQIGEKKVKALYNHTADGRRASFQYQILEGHQLQDLNGIEMFSEVYLNPGASITDLAGNPASLLLRPRDLTGVRIDGIRPELAMMASPEDGIYILDQGITFSVFWSEPVIINGTPRIGITVGTTNYNASCNTCTSSTPTTKSVFTWKVVRNSEDTNGISLTTPRNLNLTNVTIQDTAGNYITPPVELPNLSFPGVFVDGKIVSVQRLTNVNGTSYRVGEPIQIDVTFTDTVIVSGTPYLNLYIGTSALPKKLNFLKLSADKLTASFTYTVSAGDTSLVNGVTRGIRVVGPINYPSGSEIKDTDLSQQNIDPRFTDFVVNDVTVDGVAPKISNITITNGTRAQNPNAFIATETMLINLTFDETINFAITSPQTYANNIKLKLKIGKDIKEASFVSQTNSTLSMSYKIPSMTQTSALLDLDGIEITELTLGQATIKDVRGNNLDTTIRGFSQKVYVYYSYFRGRFSLLEQGHYTTTQCGSNKCLESLKDISGHNKLTFFPSGTDQIVIRDNGFGQKSKRHLRLTPSQSLYSKCINNEDPLIRYVIIVYKGPANASNTEEVSTHTLLRRLRNTPIVNDRPSYHTAIQLTSKDVEKGIYFDIDPDETFVTQRFRYNDKTFSQFISFFLNVDVWDKEQPYVLMTEYRSATQFNHTVYKTIPYGTMIGGGGFNGEIAEIIFMYSGETLKDELLDPITEQLNEIYGLY